MAMPHEVASFIEHHGLFILQEENFMDMDRISKKGQLNKRCVYIYTKRIGICSLLFFIMIPNQERIRSREGQAVEHG